MRCNKAFYHFCFNKFADTLIRHTSGNSDGVDTFNVFFKKSVDDIVRCEFTVPVAEHDGLIIMEFFENFFHRYYFRQQFSFHLS